MYLITDNYSDVMEDLLQKIEASRTTLRLVRRGADYPVAAESVSPGIPSIKGVDTVPQRDAETTDLIRREMRTLAVADIAASTPRPPQVMMDSYGLRAFMMSPLAKNADGELQGWISAHQNSAREWTPAALLAIEQAADQVQRSLDLQRILDMLLVSLGASRCTLRQNLPGDYAYAVSHESLAPNVMSIRNYRDLPQLGSPTFERIGRVRTVVVQNDCAAAADGADEEYSVAYQHKLNADYGMSAFIAAPVYDGDGELHGVISVHQTDGPRDWTQSNINEVSQAVVDVIEVLTPSPKASRGEVG